MATHLHRFIISIFIIASLSSSRIFAQLPGNSDNPFEVTIIPPSPDASALAKYADIPVSLYSDTATISIPVYEIKERELSLPISLNYHGSSGHKVETVVPRTGLGWTLEAGGLIARTVRGWPDEHAHRGFLYQAQQHDVGDYAQGTPQQQYEWYDAMAEGCLDAEPDLFYFNFAGYSGKFMFDWEVNNKLIKQWNLNYNHGTGRLTLSKINESLGSLVKPPYEFSYTGFLPAVKSFARDHGGFYNSNAAQTMIPATKTSRFGDPYPVELSGADRSPNASRVLAGMLSQITHPTGGKDVLTFEPHDYSFEQSEELDMKSRFRRQRNYPTRPTFVSLELTLNQFSHSKSY